MVTIKVDPKNVARVEFNPGEEGVSTLDLIKISGVIIKSLIDITAHNSLPYAVAEEAVMTSYKLIQGATDKSIMFKGQKGTD